MKFLLATIITLAATSCSAPTEKEVVKDFFEKVTIEKEYKEAYEMLSKRSKERATYEQFLGKFLEVYKVPKYKGLIDFENKSRSFQLVKMVDKGPDRKKAYFTFTGIRYTADFFSGFDHFSKMAESEDAEEIYANEKVKEFLKARRMDLYSTKKESYRLVKEDGEWKIDISSPENFFDDKDFYSAIFKDKEKYDREQRRIAALNEKSFIDVIAQQLLAHMSVSRAQGLEILKCISGKLEEKKFGARTYADVTSSYSEEERTGFVKSCMY